MYENFFVKENSIMSQAVGVYSGKKEWKNELNIRKDVWDGFYIKNEIVINEFKLNDKKIIATK